MTGLEPATLADRVLGDGETPLVLDVRPEEEFAAWHIPGSVNVDVYDRVSAEPTRAKEAFADLPDDREIVTVCAAGVVADTATDLLQEMGYDARTLADGLAGWSRVHRSAPVPAPVDGTVIQVARPGKGCLSHVLISDGEAAVVDPSHYLDEYDDILADRGVDLVGVLDSHAHADHVSGGRALADRHGVPYYLHPADAIGIDATAVTDGQILAVGDLTLEVVHTPGHSEGSITVDVDGGALLTGDTLFHESVGRVELGVAAGIEESDVAENAATLYESLQRLVDRPDDAVVLPAHDPGSPEPPVAARLAAVRERNEDLRRGREALVRRLATDVPDHPPNFERVKRVNVGTASVPEDELASLELGPNNCAAD